MDSIYKFESQPNENNRKDEILNDTSNKEEEDYDIYEYIIDNIYNMTEMVSDENEEIQLEALRWFHKTFRGINYVLASDLIVRIFNLVFSTNELISKEALKIIHWAVSFNSAMQDSLLKNGLLKYIMTYFPEKGTSFFSYNLASQSITARQILIQNGIIEKLRSIEENNQISTFAKQLASLVNLPFTEIDPDLLSEIFDTFQILWAHLHEHDRKFNRIIVTGTQKLLKSNINFLYAFMTMDLFTPFLHVPENLNENDEPYLSSVFKMLLFIINQNEEFAIELIHHGVIHFADQIITNEDQLFPDASIDAMNFLTDLMFYRPEIIESVYDCEIPHCVLDLFEDAEPEGRCMIDALSFTVVMMALASPMIYSKMKSIGCYTMIVENVMEIEDLYWKWTIRVIYRGFVTGKIEANEENRQFLSSNDDLITWLENVKRDSDLDVSNAALQLLVKIFPDYINS